MEKQIKRRATVYALTGALLAIILGTLCYTIGTSPTIPIPMAPLSLNRFSSYSELVNFVKTQSEPLIWWLPDYSLNVPKGVEGTNLDYSHTNIQVAGVDEADIVKTDGTYIYFIAQGKVFVIKAYPVEEARVLSQIIIENGEPKELFLYQQRLIVISVNCSSVSSRDGTQTIISIYNVEQPETPQLLKQFTFSGSYLNSRRIDEYVYLIIAKTAIVINETWVPLPTISIDAKTYEIPATAIHYFNTSDNYFSFTTIFALDVSSFSFSNITLLLGCASNIYMSKTNLYLTVPGRESTTICRIGINKEKIFLAAYGAVPGRILNQFSMDEYAGFFRIATTTGHVARVKEQANAENNIYILDMNLTIIGRLEHLAKGEKIYAARFIGDRCYLVTFKKVDPLFVIDVSNPVKPRVLGKLKIPGYSDYLHPYDATHLIGIGKNTVEAEEGDFAWYQGIKISLFDVSDVNAPKELDKVILGDRGTDSPVLRDHKALLFSKEKQLLVIPIVIAEIDESKYPHEIPPNVYSRYTWRYIWQGVIVFRITQDSIILRGKIPHLPENQEEISPYSPAAVKRSLYIEKVLFTFSEVKIKITSLIDLAIIKEISLKD